MNFSGIQIIGWIIALSAIAYAATHPNEVKKAASHVGGFAITAVAFMLILTVGLPFLADWSEYLFRGNYSDVLDGDPNDIEIDLDHAIDLLKPPGGNNSAPSLDDYTLPGLDDPQHDDLSSLPEDTTAPILPPTEGDRIHVVVAGDTLKTVADRYGKTVAELVALNSISDPNRISVGQQLLIERVALPLPTATPEPAGTETADAETPTRTPTPPPSPTVTNLEIYYQSMAALRTMGSQTCPDNIQRLAEGATQATQFTAVTARMCAKMLVERVLEIRPGDELALGVREEIEINEQRLASIKALGERVDGNMLGLKPFNYAAGFTEEVDAVLRGLTLKVISVDPAWNGSTWLSGISVEITSNGWLYGERFTMSAGHATRHGGKQEGNIFTVR